MWLALFRASPACPDVPEVPEAPGTQKRSGASALTWGSGPESPTLGVLWTGRVEPSPLGRLSRGSCSPVAPAASRFLAHCRRAHSTRRRASRFSYPLNQGFRWGGKSTAPPAAKRFVVSLFGGFNRVCKLVRSHGLGSRRSGGFLPKPGWLQLGAAVVFGNSGGRSGHRPARGRDSKFPAPRPPRSERPAGCTRSAGGVFAGPQRSTRWARCCSQRPR